MGQIVSAKMDPKHDKSWWQNDEIAIKNLCAEQLFSGRLLLVLGAGVSIAYGLPSWSSLIDNAYDISGQSKPEGVSDLLLLADYLFVDIFYRDEAKFAEIIRKALFYRYNYSAASIGSNMLLQALSSLTMPSMRGQVREVITFNFDDLLENYLRQYGFVSDSIVRLPFWSSRADVRVYHPHGLLPVNTVNNIPDSIFFAQIQFEENQIKKKVWYDKIAELMASHTCIFLGISGEDTNIRSLLSEVKKRHVSQSGDGAWAYWGIRFSDNEEDPKKADWERRGVVQQTLNSYEDLPNWLLDISQRASTMAPASLIS